MNTKFGRKFTNKPPFEGEGYKNKKRHPSYLKGREIGLWYASRMKKRTQKEERMMPSVKMDYQKEMQLTDLLHNLRTTERHQSNAHSNNSFSRPNASTSSSLFSHFSQIELDENEAEDLISDDIPSFDYDLERNDFLLEYQNHLTNNGKPLLQHEVNKDGMKRKPELDLQFKVELEEKNFSSAYRKMLDFRKKLPSFNMQTTIIDLINDNQVVVISGETGCGKTTQVVQFILDDQILQGQGSVCRIVCTQPRRISAISVAERVAEERGEKIGNNESVGYHIRLESKFPRDQGSILFCTTGIILQYLQGDPFLSKVSHLLVDEIHERDLHSDFLLIILKNILSQRPDFRLILMSATINAKMFSKFYNNCPMITIPGFTFPVKEFLLEDIIELTGFLPKEIPKFQPFRRRKKKSLEETNYEQNLEVFLRNSVNKYSHRTLNIVQIFNDNSVMMFDLIVHLIKHIIYKFEEGAILVFLPGWEDIKKLNDMLLKDVMFSPSNFRILPLHSLMPTINQKEVFCRPPSGVRKIIIATNIAETSITIDDIIFVIDSGKIKMKKFDVENKIVTLKPEWVSLANAHQRRGRAGRVQKGYCFHLYTKVREDSLAQYQLPEMLRTPLEELCLQIKVLKLGKIIPFVIKALEPPSVEAVASAINNLTDMNALDEYENLTPLGFHLARLPVEPHIGKMILFAGIFSCLDPILTVAVSLSFKEPFMIPLGKEAQVDHQRCILSQGSKSDHKTIINAFQGWEEAKSKRCERSYCWENFLSPSTLKLLSNMKEQLSEMLYKLGFLHSANVKDPRANQYSKNVQVINAVLCAGLYPNVARVVNRFSGSYSQRRPKIQTKIDRKISIHPKSVNANTVYFESPFLIFHQKMKSTEVYLHDCTMILPYALLFFGSDFVIKESHVEMDEWLNISITSQTAYVIKELRFQMNKLLEYKITHPAATNWHLKTTEGALLHAIVDLLTSEQIPIMEKSRRTINS